MFARPSAGRRHPRRKHKSIHDTTTITSAKTKVHLPLAAVSREAGQKKKKNARKANHTMHTREPRRKQGQPCEPAPLSLLLSTTTVNKQHPPTHPTHDRHTLCTPIRCPNQTLSTCTPDPSIREPPNPASPPTSISWDYLFRATHPLDTTESRAGGPAGR